jgi:hypothetical protein
MIKPRVFALGNLVAMTLLFLAGCGASTATVSGTVSYDGTAIEKGMVTFTPEGTAGSVVGAEILAGKYVAKGVAPGKNIVQVVAVKSVPFVRSSEEMAKMAEEQKGKTKIDGLIDPADVVPPNAVGNNAAHNFVEGSNQLDLTLTKPL